MSIEVFLLIFQLDFRTLLADSHIVFFYFIYTMTETSAVPTKLTPSTPIAPRKRRPIPEAIQDALSMGAQVQFDEELGGWVILGFYRAKSIVVRYAEGASIGVATATSTKKRQNVTGQNIASFDDLVELNYAWWSLSRKEHVDYESPEDGWRDEFVARDWVERRTLILPKKNTFVPQ
jgi:hypothetical protein